jgi:hypothetical protein
MNSIIAFRNFSRFCVIFIISGIQPIFGQVLTETVWSSTIDPIPDQGIYEVLVPCGGFMGYQMQINITGLNTGTDYELVYNDWFGTPGSLMVTSDSLGSASTSIFIDFTDYSQSMVDFTAEYTLLLNGTPLTGLIVVHDPFVIHNPNYNLTTTYYDGSNIDVYLDAGLIIPSSIGSCIPNDGGDYTNTACLYYQNTSHSFTRITDISLDDLGLTPNSLTLRYTPENEIYVTLLKVECTDATCQEIILYPLNQTTTEIVISEDMILELVSGNGIRVIEEFIIQDCGSVEDFAETELRLVPCPDVDFVQNHPMNVMVDTSGPPIRYCFNIEHDGIDINGIPLFNDEHFDLRFTFRNPEDYDASPNTGHKELGWIVLPMDLKPLIPGFNESWTMADVNAWLAEHTFLQLEPDQDLNLDNCSALTNPSILLNIPNGFVRVFEPSMAYDSGMEGSCTEPDNLDPFRRVVLDFSQLNQNYVQMINVGDEIFNENSPLTNWYSEYEGDVWNTFMQGTRFSVVFQDFVFDYTQFESVNGQLTVVNDSEIIDDYYFLHDCEPEGACNYGCGAGGFSLFEIPGLLFQGLYPFHHFYVVSKDMCDRLASGNSEMPILQNLVADQNCPELSGVVNGYMTPLNNNVNDLQYRNPHVTVTPLANPPGIIDVMEYLEVEFQYGMLTQSAENIPALASNPWNYQQGSWETLFGCDHQENRGRISMPLALAHRCDISVTNNEHPNGCNGLVMSTSILSYFWNGPDTFADCADLYIIDNLGQRQPLVDGQGNVATCSIDGLFYVDFELDQLAIANFNDPCNSIVVHAQWTYTGANDPNGNGLSCPVICGCDSCALDGGTQEADLRMTIYTVCHEAGVVCPPVELDSSPSNDEIYIHQLACSQQEIFYVCGPPCTVDFHCYSNLGFDDFHACSNELEGLDHLTVSFNTLVMEDGVNPFRMIRNTFGYDIDDYTVNVDLDGDGIVDDPETMTPPFDPSEDTDGDFYFDEALTFNQENGFTTADIAEASHFLVDDNDDGVQDEENESLIHFLPGDQILIQARGVYSAAIGDSTDCTQLPGNALLTYVIQTDLEPYIFELPCVPGDDLPNQYEISLTFTQDSTAHVFHASDFIISNCNYMEDPIEGTETKTTLIFVFEDFYNGNCTDGTLLTGAWEVEFNGFVFMTPSTSSSVSFLNEIMKGSFALLDPDYDGNAGYCPVVYSCDNNTTVGNYHQLWVDYDLKLGDSREIFTSCTRPYLLKVNYMSSQGALLHDIYGEEYRPIFGINSIEFNSLNSQEFLDLDHRYWGNPLTGAGLWYQRSSSEFAGGIAERNFYSRQSPAVFSDHFVYIEPSLMGMPELNANGFAARTIYGSAEVKTQQFEEGLIATENQQIGESALVDLEGLIDFEGQIMQCGALAAALDLDYYLDDHITAYLALLHAAGSCTEASVDNIMDDVPLSTYTDLKNNRSGFASGLTQDNDIVSQSGIFRGADFEYFDFTNPGGNATTMSFFVTIEDLEGIEFTGVRLVKEVDYNNSTDDQEIVYQSLLEQDSGGSTTYYFHQDEYHTPTGKDYFMIHNRELNRMFLLSNNVYELNWHLEFDYTLTDCIDGGGGLIEDPDQGIDFKYYFGQACAWYENAADSVPHFTRCQTCVSMNPNCPDCGNSGVVSASCLDDAQIDDGGGGIITLDASNSLVGVLQGIEGFPTQQYHTGYDGFVGEISASWGNEFLTANISITDSCEQSFCVDLMNGDNADLNVMDASIESITIQYPSSWPILEVLNLTNSNGLNVSASINYITNGATTTATVVFNSDTLPMWLHAEESLLICFHFVDWDMSVFEQGTCTVMVNATTICGNVMSVDNGITSFQIGGIVGLNGELTLDETNPCIPQLCGSITGQTGNMESITISYPSVWIDPILVSSSCDACLASADYSVPGEVTLNFTQDYIVSNQTVFNFCFDFDLVDPLIWNNVFGIASADLVMSFDYLTPCGDAIMAMPDSALWEVPNPSLVSSLEINIENCSPVACLTYVNDGDQSVFINSIQLSPNYYDSTVVTGDCIGCTFTPITVLGHMMLLPADSTTEAQLQLTPGESLELCISLPIENPLNYQNMVMPLNVTTPFDWSCGPVQNEDYPVSSDTFQLFQNFDFSISFNETMAGCIGGIVQSDGSANIQPYNPGSFAYAWTTFPAGFDPNPFVYDSSNLLPGSYGLTLTDNETGCFKNYDLVIESEDCCQIALFDSSYVDCVATYYFDIMADCDSPLVGINVTDPTGGLALFTQNLVAGILEVSFETEFEGVYFVDVQVLCDSGNICDNLSISLDTEPTCLSLPIPNCLAIWDNEVANTYMMQGNAVISNEIETAYTVLGSAHEPNSMLNYYYARLEGDDSYIYARDFGNDINIGSKTEYILDAVEHEGFIYNVGYGEYAASGLVRNWFMISKINKETGAMILRRRYHLSQSSNDIATGIDIYQLNGITRLVVAGYTDVNQSQRRMDAFATTFSLDLVIGDLYTYDYNAKDNYMYEVKNVGQTSRFVVVGKHRIGASTFVASALMLDYALNVTDEFTFKYRVSEITSVDLHENELFFVGSYSPGSNETKAMIFKSGLSWGSNIDFRSIENTGDVENFDWARDIVIHNSRVYIAGESGTNTKRGLLVELNPISLNPVWSKHTDPALSLKAISDIKRSDGSTGIIAIGDTKRQGEDAIAIVHMDLDGNSCCVDSTSLKMDLINETFLFGYTRLLRTPGAMSLSLGLTPFEIIPVCDPEFKGADIEIMVSSDNEGLLVIPNPSAGRFELMLTAQQAWLSEVVIIDVTGQIIFKSNYQDHDELHSVTIGDNLALVSGMYLVQARLSDGELLTTRVVVSK